MCSAYETPQLSATADNSYEMPYSAYETVRSAATSDETEMYASIRDPAVDLHENSSADATAAAAAGHEYQTPRLPPATTPSNGTDGYAKLRQPGLPPIHANTLAAAAGTDSAVAGVDTDGYEIPRSTDETPSHARAYIEILPDAS